ncbi:MAG: DegT/DnrJ/EryC1/StrS family aminotransferase [Deltaproteobacteria bacterium]|nr:DegT/DnrJ/EryC1/StrS family aminotransferase [Deltaproteobacteria bacterium]
MSHPSVPFFRPTIEEDEIAAVTAVLRSGWLTTGPETREFEREFAAYVGARHAVAVNSCTAALHLALETVGLKRGDLVLVPTFTFAATAEVVRYFDATPVLVDCEPTTLCLDLAAARRTLEALTAGRPVAGVRAPYGRVRAVIPMHYAGQALDVEGVRALAREFDLRVVEDAAHALPADYRDGAGAWRRIGANTADATCFSFYANKTITTGEGGMLCTDDDGVAERARIMALHGISRDAWKRYTAEGSWYYEIVAPGFKYNMTDVAAALGRCQLRKCDRLAAERRRLAEAYRTRLGDVDALELPREAEGRHHAWHLFVIRLNLERLRIDRAAFVDELKRRGVMFSVAWLPLHMHPYYRETYGIRAEDLPVAAREWLRVVSLPLFPGMTAAEHDAVVAAVREIVAQHRR